MKRRFPSPRDFAPLLKFRRPTFDSRTRRLESAITITDLRAIAKRRTPKAVFDYVEGGAEKEISLARARQAFEDIEFHPAVLRDVAKVDTGRSVLGARVELPFAIAPIGFTRLMHADGEIAGASSAAAAGIPFTLSTMGTTPIEDVARIGGRRWFQLYVWKDRARSAALVHRAADAGFDTLVVTVDVPVAGARHRDTRNGFSIPPTLTAGTLFNMALHPEWWINMLTTEPLAFANLHHWNGTVSELLDAMFDPTVNDDDLTWIRDQWPGRLIVKGVQTIRDARRLADLGVDGLVVSNHGGRQLDRAPIPFHLLPQVVQEVGEVEVLVDTGIMSGTDIVACIALGARCTLVGRAYLYGLMAGGRPGVDRAISILEGEIVRTMRLLGVTCLDELEPGHVTQLQRLVPRSERTRQPLPD